MDPAGYEQFKKIHLLMDNIKNILVCLDLTAMDRDLIRYAAYFAEKTGCKNVTFFHAIQAYDLPNRSSRSFPDVETELSDLIRTTIHQYVDQQFEDTITWQVEMRTGYENAAEEVIRYANEGDFDLTLIGQKTGENRAGLYGQKIAGEIATDLLLVPEQADYSLSGILCALDFSEPSRKAFEWSLKLAEKENEKPELYFVTNPARAFFPVTTDRSYSMQTKKYLRQVDQFLEQYNLTRAQVTTHIELNDQFTSEAEKIYEMALISGHSLIIVGTRGDTANVTSLLGNLTESFRLMEKEIPVLIVKPAAEPRSWFSGS